MAAVSAFNLLLILLSLFTISSAQDCFNAMFSHNRVFDSCTNLPYLKSQLHWRYFPSHRKVSIAYRARQAPTGWIAWGINPTNIGMVGSQVLVAFRNANGRMFAHSTRITSYDPSMLPEKLSFHVSNISAEYANHEMTIYAIVGPLKRGTSFNHVWQAGSLVLDGIPQMHSTSPSNLQSMGTIEFNSV